MRFKNKRMVSLLCILTLVCLMMSLSVFALENTKRNETLYLNGIAWGAPPNFNMFTPDAAFPCNQDRFLIYEALFMYNQLTGNLEPLVGKSYTWNSDNSLTVELNKNAHWNDGVRLTAEDVAYTYMIAKKYPTFWSTYLQYIDDVKVTSPSTVVIVPNKNKFNQLVILTSLCRVPLHPKHIWSKIEAKAGGKIEGIRKEFNGKPVGSGPYKLYYYDDTRIILVRDDKYWGKALFGKLPAPKYISHIIFKSNDAGNLALKNGEVDVSQQFIPKVWLMWRDKSPIKTYLDDFPYYIPGSTPTVFFNMAKKGLNVLEVRKAIAMCIDYKKIGEVAMSGYTDPIVPSIALNTPAESKFIDEKVVKPLRWTTDVEAANKLLDSIGAKPGPDGIRVLKDGTRLGPYELECPYGWSDWNASLEIIAQCAKKIGIEMRTKFPETPVWQIDRANGTFDIVMDTPCPYLGPGMPWDRARFLMSSDGVPPIGQAAFWNWGRFKNARADELLDIIPTKKDPNELKTLYTELDKIFLQNVPAIQLMYRPWMFYTVSERVWKGFPDAKHNPKNIPPTICCDQAAIRMLYDIRSTGK